MKRKLSYFMVIAAFLSFGFLASCGDDEANTETEEVTETETEEVTESEEVVADFSAGQAIYEGKGLCHTCHMPTGEGVEGTFPPLANSDFLQTLTGKDLINTVIYGNTEPITVNGVEYPGNIMNATMSAVEFTDQEIVDVVNYVSNKWGTGEIVTLEDVAAAKE
jgi:mono/diheme cytochrome c family protein